MKATLCFAVGLTLYTVITVIGIQLGDKPPNPEYMQFVIKYLLVCWLAYAVVSDLKQKS